MHPLVQNWQEMAAGWSVDEVTNFYSSYAKSYDDQIQTDSYPAPSVIGSWVLDHLSKLSQNSDPSEALRVLDLGCGTGQRYARIESVFCYSIMEAFIMTRMGFLELQQFETFLFSASSELY